MPVESERSPSRVVLAARQAPHASGLLGAIRGCLAALGDDRDLVDVAGLSGLAFRLQVDETVSPASLSAFPWSAELPGMLARLGAAAEIVCADDADPDYDARRRDAVGLAIDAIRRGRPSILWGVQLPEFGVVHGFDEERGTLLVSGVIDEREGLREIAWSAVGRGDVPLLFLAAFEERRAIAPEAAFASALRYAARAARGLTTRNASMIPGVDAYDVWIDALSSGRIDPAGHALVAGVLAEARAAAPPFLRRAADAFARIAVETRAHAGPDTLDRAAADHLDAAAAQLRAAAGAYQRAADGAVELSAAWPFPIPEGTSLTTSARRRHHELLDAIAEAERQGVDALERAADLARRHDATRGLVVVDASPDDRGLLFDCVRDLPVDLETDERALRDTVRIGDDGLSAIVLAERTQALHAQAHLYHADLERSGAAVVARGKWRYVYCLSVARARRGAGLGRALVERLRDRASRDGYDGLLVEATSQEVYLHYSPYEALGFQEIDRRDDDSRLLWLPLRDGLAPPRLHANDPDPPDAPAIRVSVSRGRPCPLVWRRDRNVIAAARRCVEAGLAVTLDENLAPPHGVVLGGIRLPLVYIPEPAAHEVLSAAATQKRTRTP